VKAIADFSGCLHFRHPKELGGAVFSLSIFWTQIFPFVALQFYDDDDSNHAMKNSVTTLLVVSVMLWMLLNVVFFCTIDLAYIATFFSTKTGPQYVCEQFQTSSENESARFEAVFNNRLSYTKSIEGDVKEWVAEKIDNWTAEKPSWFKIEMIPASFLPREVRRPSEQGRLNTRRGNHAAYSNCTLCIAGVAEPLFEYPVGVTTQCEVIATSRSMYKRSLCLAIRPCGGSTVAHTRRGNHTAYSNCTLCDCFCHIA